MQGRGEFTNAISETNEQVGREGGKQCKGMT